MSRVALSIALAGLTLVVAACAPGPAPSGSTGAGAAAPPPPSAKMAPLEAGVTDLGDGRVVANGWLQEVDVDGGTWLLVSQPPTSSANDMLIAVLVPGSVTDGQLDALRGTFFGAEGRVTGTWTAPSGAPIGGGIVSTSAPLVAVDAIRAY